jgi:competence ComEA-like helix-hairpin-helix protein
LHYRAAMPWRSLLRIYLLVYALSLLAAGLPAKKKPPSAPVNLNTATSKELQQVPGIGPVNAEKILQMRKAYGSFKSVDDLLAIKGIGPKRLEKMRKYLVAGKTTPARSAHPPRAEPAISPSKGPPSGNTPDHHPPELQS